MCVKIVTTASRPLMLRFYNDIIVSKKLLHLQQYEISPEHHTAKVKIVGQRNFDSKHHPDDSLLTQTVRMAH